MSYVFCSTSINLIYGLLLPFTPFLSVGSCHLCLFPGEFHSSQIFLDYASSVCSRLTGFPLETWDLPVVYDVAVMLGLGLGFGFGVVTLSLVDGTTRALDIEERSGLRFSSATRCRPSHRYGGSISRALQNRMCCVPVSYTAAMDSRGGGSEWRREW